jgi:hypothetical protein
VSYVIQAEGLSEEGAFEKWEAALLAAPGELPRRRRSTVDSGLLDALGFAGPGAV